MSRSAYIGRALTRHLREIAAEAETITDDGALVTKGEVLARLIWKRALGWTEMVRVPTDEGVQERPFHHKPEQWAAVLIFDRMEGRVPEAVQDETSRVTIADKVSKLGAKIINAQALAAGGEETE